MRHATIAASLLAALGVAAGRLTAQAAGPGHCYEVQLGPWAPQLALGADTAFSVPPRRFHVDARPDSTLGRTAYPVRALPGAGGPVHSRGQWSVVRPDSVRVVFTTGFSGVVLQLSQDGTTWVGVASTFWDFPRQEQNAPVTLVPTGCPGAGSSGNRLRGGVSPNVR
jgi:hypothetical protein